MSIPEFGFVCAGCGAPAGPLPFTCPDRPAHPEADHVLEWSALKRGSFADGGEPNPYRRFRALSYSHDWWVRAGRDESEFIEVVEALDGRVAHIAGHGFRATPCFRSTVLETALGGRIWIKDETGQVGDSHKARHLMGIALDLELRKRAGQTVPTGPLAIASCGNAALAAAVVARAWDREIRVFIPTSADPEVVTRLESLQAKIEICPRQPEVPGDPCVHAFRDAVRAGAVPFCCQGPENGLTIEGGQTLAWEMATAWASADIEVDRIFIQVGGGALAASTVRGLRVAVEVGLLRRMPAVHTVQTGGCYPLARAYDRVAARVWERLGVQPPVDRLEGAARLAEESAIVASALQDATAHRGTTMWPWETAPASVAHGILDDETYDWRAVVAGMLQTGGVPWVVAEDTLRRAKGLADRANATPVCHTGASGLAGLMQWAGATGGHLGLSAVIFSGKDRAVGA